MRLEKIKFGILSFVLCFFVSACSVFSPVKSEPVNTYMLTLNSAPQVKKNAHGPTLLVTTPQSSAVYNTAQMAYSTHPYAIAYYSKNQWADAPAQMLQPLMVQALQKSKRFKEVLSPSDLGHFDYVLNSELLTIQQNFYGGSSQEQIVLRAQLVSAATNQVIAMKDFSVTEPAAPNPYGGVVAANKGVEQMLAQLRKFVLAHI